eukprot:gnl/MRDRNA2_/MRDRNA2_29780_c0_seq1.p1 gnl/MRDRNA2_/MRDRNA2_29780_c0~~gnl/MRDRNA2_/MRDRNA2_29780_c0_seq1.p1  ORF type:complete len:283 (-),score=29.84 gnl/MRDRNA2_/MRDRNA2_29780_c0_seq1:107-955(-)
MSRVEMIKSNVINFVNPKLVYFSNSFQLACMIGAVTFVCWVIAWAAMANASTTAEVTSVGDENAHYRFMMAVQEEGADLCLKASMVMRNGNPGQVNAGCLPRQNMFEQDKMPKWTQEWTKLQPLKWCEDGMAWGRDDMCKSFKCAPCDSGRGAQGGIQPDGSVSMFTWSKTIFPPGGSTFGSSLGYAAYIEVGATLLIVGCLLRSGSIKNHRPDFGLLSVSMEEMSTGKSQINELEKQFQLMKTAMTRAGIRIDEESPEQAAGSLRAIGKPAGESMPGMVNT